MRYIKKVQRAKILSTLTSLHYQFLSRSINSEDVYNHFKDKPIGEFLQFLNDFGSFLTKWHLRSLQKHCRQLLFGKDKAIEVAKFFRGIGNVAAGKACSIKVAEKNSYFFP